MDDGLPASVDNSLKAHTQAMPAIGVDTEDGLNMTRAMIQNEYQRDQIIQIVPPQIPHTTQSRCNLIVYSYFEIKYFWTPLRIADIIKF